MKHNPPAPNAKEIRDAIYSYAPYDLLRVLVLPKNLIRGRISRLMCEFGVREMSDNRELRPTRSDELSAFWPSARTARAHRFEPRRDSGSTSGSTSRVAMMQAANLRNRDDVTKRRRLDITRRRRVAIERQMRPRLVIVAEVIGNDSLQMPFVQHDDTVQAFSPYTPDYTLAVRVLPRRTRCRGNFLDAHALNALRELLTVDSITIPNQESRSHVVRKGILDLLASPSGMRIGRDVEMDYLATIARVPRDSKHAHPPTPSRLGG